MNLVEVLKKTFASNHVEIQQANQLLEEAAQQNLPEFLKQLASILHTATADPQVRQQAGIQLKNYLTSKDLDRRSEFQARWVTFSEDIRLFIKQSCLSTLGTETSRPSTAAQCIAYIAIIEIPTGLWPDVITKLCQNVTLPDSTEMLRESCLEALGYICQDIDPHLLVSQSNEVLTAICHGMRKEETSHHVKLAATNALLNSLEFTKSNFDRDSERHFIMQVVCEATQCPDVQVQVSALQCLVKIMSLYYTYMEHYMGPALFSITIQAIESANPEIALQGVEFWSNVCDEEVDLALEASEAQEQGRPPARVSRHYAKGALQFLVPKLLGLLTKQDEGDDEDDWNPSKAAGVCLMLLANCCEDDVLGYVFPFVQTNISNPEWNMREAAVLAFGSILEGPDPNTLRPIVEQSIPLLITLMRDSNVLVRDTTAWTIGRACEMIPEAVLNDQQTLMALIEVLLLGLEAEPRVAVNACWAFNSLGEAAYERAEHEADAEPRTYLLSQFFEVIVAKLLTVTERQDASQANLRSSAYEALMEFIKNSPDDCYPIVQRTTMVILERVQQVLQMESHVSRNNAPTEKNPYNELQSCLCASLQSVLRKMTKEDVPKISDVVMSALLQILSSAQRTGSVQEDALVTVGTLIEVLGDDFLKYMEVFKPYLLLGLANHQEYQVCQIAIGLVSDIGRGMSSKMLPYCDEFMHALVGILNNAQVHKSVRPYVLTAFGDIALAIGPAFSKYLDVVLQILITVTSTQVDRNDYEMVDYLNTLRENSLEAFSGIIQGLKGDQTDQSAAHPAVLNNAELARIGQYLPQISQFLIMVASDPDTQYQEGLMLAFAGLIGDISGAFGVDAIIYIEADVIQNMLTKMKKSKNHKNRTLASWAMKEIRRLRNQAHAQATGAQAGGAISHPVVAGVPSAH